MNWLTSKFKKVEVDCYLCGKKVAMSKWEDGSHRYLFYIKSPFNNKLNNLNILDSLVCMIMFASWKPNLVNSSFIVPNADDE